MRPRAKPMISKNTFMDKRLNWIGDNPQQLEPDERLAFLAKRVKWMRTSGRSQYIPKGSLVIYSSQDNSIRIRYNERGHFGIWTLIRVSPDDIMESEWKKIK